MTHLNNCGFGGLKLSGSASHCRAKGADYIENERQAQCASQKTSADRKRGVEGHRRAEELTQSLVNVNDHIHVSRLFLGHSSYLSKFIENSAVKLHQKMQVI